LMRFQTKTIGTNVTMVLFWATNRC